jgi:hypothetical protein
LERWIRIRVSSRFSGAERVLAAVVRGRRNLHFVERSAVCRTDSNLRRFVHRTAWPAFADARAELASGNASAAAAPRRADARTGCNAQTAAHCDAQTAAGCDPSACTYSNQNRCAEAGYAETCTAAASANGPSSASASNALTETLGYGLDRFA